MANLLLLYASPQLTAVSPRTFTPLLLSPKPPHSLSLPHSAAHCQLIPNPLFHSKLHRRSLSVRAFDSSDETRNEDDKNTESDDKEEKPESEQPITATAKKSDVDYPHGEFEFKKKFGFWTTFFMKLRMLIAFPWERVRKGSVLAMKLRGEISDLPKSRFSSALSLPQICENFIKAAYDPRIPGIYLEIDSLACGWGKVEEIRRHILDFKKSGKFIVAYIPTCREKEYYLACACSEIYAPPSAYFSLYGLTVEASFLGGVLEKVGIQPELQRIGKYKSAGDQLLRKSMSDANCEMLTALLDDIYGNWLDKVSSDRGIKREDLENFISEGVYQVDRLKDDGLITDILYDDEVKSLLKERLGVKKEKDLPTVDYRFPPLLVKSFLKERLGVKKEKDLPTVDYRKYSQVSNWTLGLTGGKDEIAVIRASGSISRVRGSLSSDGIYGEQFIEKIRKVRENETYKAVIIRIDSPGGDALASDLMWREIRLLAASKPVVASMGDVAASGGYYMAMATDAIVAENLTLTGSIGVIAGKFNFGKLYEKIGYTKEIISRGKYAELLEADQRPFNPDEAKLFEKSAQYAYKQFRDKAALSRSMDVDEMETVAQGRVWTGIQAASRGLVDATGGLSRAVAIAKLKANIPQDKPVTLVEMSRPSPMLLDLVSSVNDAVAGVRSVREVLQELTVTEGVQTRMEGIMFQRYGNPIISLIKDILGSI